jgi:3-hydroxyacyl-[acyl-carrier-protein] dehydratase
MSQALVRNMFRIGEPAKADATGTYTWRVEPIAEHAIHGGHFPDRPITPGAAMVQLIQHLASQAHGTTLRLKSARNIKFLTPVDPVKCAYFNVRMSLIGAADGTVGIDAEANTDAYDGNPVVLLKLKAVLAQ